MSAHQDNSHTFGSNPHRPDMLPSPDASNGVEGPKDHPEGEEIRRQVEFYFSDGNLATDNHLLGLCRGRENLPVSISQILGFKKMRRFRPKKLVVESLRKSDFLEVDAAGKTIKRKIPIRIPTLLDDDDDDEELAHDPDSVTEERKPTPRKAKKVVVQTTLRKEVPPGMTKNMVLSLIFLLKADIGILTK